MLVKIKTPLVCLLLYLFSSSSLAQKSIFYLIDKSKKEYSSTFELEFTNLNFIKNNEYFNNIADGYTILGTQVQPTIIYNRNKKIQFKAGFMAVKYFGENTVDVFIPTFSFEFKSKNQSFVFGNFTPRANHGLIEPLMGNEKVLSPEVVETGLQYKYNSNLFKSELWFNWENFIRPNDEQRERFTIGLSSETIFFDNLSAYIQGYYYHEGGQINKKLRDSLNTNNNHATLNHLVGAVGLKYKLLKSSNNNLSLNGYYLLHNYASGSNTLELPFENGAAYYLYLNYKLRNINLLLGYYKANKFIAVKGNEMFQTFSQKSNVNYWNGIPDDRFIGLVEPNRSLIFSRLFYENFIDKNIKIGVQLETYYQLNDSGEIPPLLSNRKYRFDCSYGFYVIFNDVFSF